MKSMKPTIPSTSLRLVAIACASVGTALAGSSISTDLPLQAPPAAASSGWEFRIEPYLWLPGLNGTVGVAGVTTDIDVSFSDLVDSSSSSDTNFDLNAIFAMQLEARNGRWGIMTDLMYVDLEITGTPPTALHKNADLGYKQFVGDLIGTYRLREAACGFLDFYAGARVNSLSLDIHADANIAREIDESQTETWVDPIIGLRGQWGVSENFFVAGKADIGGFGVSSEFLWSAQATIGYQFTDWFNTEIGYRYTDTDYKDNGFTYDLALDGLFAGFNFIF